MDLVDRLRGAGHAAVISGAGPSVLVLTRGDALAAVRSLTSNDWTVLDPGIPATGAQLRDLVRGEDR
jgi:homoserine kinase